MDIYLVVIILYLVFLVGVGVVKSRGVKDQEGFMVAGRSVSATFLVATLVCTWIGSGSLFGGAGRAYREGFSALWMSAGAWVGIAIVYFLAPRVRRIAQYTVPDILEMRYTPAARVLGTLAIVIAYLTIASYQFMGGGRLLHILVPSIDPSTGRLFACAFVVVVIALAGMRSIVSVDLINGIMIPLGILIAAPIALSAAGGWSGLTTTLPETHFTTFGNIGWASCLGLFFPTLFLLLGESGMYQKFMSARSEIDAKKAVIGMIVGVIVVETVLDSVAIFGAGVHWGSAPFQGAEGMDRATTETIILFMARHDMPTLAGVILLVGAVAIIFSTATTFLIVPSTNITRDLYQRFINPQASQKGMVLFQRLTIVVLAAVSLIVTNFFTNVLDMALYAYTMVGAAVTPALLVAFLSRRVTPIAGTVSVAAGMLATIVFGALNQLGWEELPLGFGLALPLDYDYIVYPAATASLLSLVLVSLFTPAPSEEKWRPFWAKAAQAKAD
jgi:SSS family solute:Na+ symporter/sodium/proline symporter